MIGYEGKEGNWAYLRFCDLQVPHLNATGSEVRDFELDVNGPLGLAQLASATHTTTKTARHASTVLIISLDGWQSQFSPHKELFAPTKLLDLPNDG